MVQNLKDESYFVAVVKKGRGFRERELCLAEPRKIKIPRRYVYAGSGVQCVLCPNQLVNI